MDIAALFNEVQLESVAKRLQSPFGLTTRDNKINGKVYKNSFMGCEAADWFCQDLLLTRPEATALGRLMHAQNLLVTLYPDSKEKGFLDEADALYAFQEIDKSKTRQDKSAPAKKSTTAVPRQGLVVGLDTLSLADIKEQVQRQMFGSEEEVRVVIRVVPGRLKRVADKARGASPTPLEDPELVCVTTKGDSRIMIQRIMYSHGTYSFGATWQAEDLRAVNPEENSDVGFVLSFERAYHFTAESSAARNEFLWCILQLCQDYLNRMPQTTVEILELRLLLEGEGMKDLVSVESDESRYITEEEERQIDELLKSRVSTEGAYDIDTLAEELSKDLIRLETANINDLIKSHTAIKQMAVGIASAQTDLKGVANQFAGYKNTLEMTRKSFEQIEQKNNRTAVVSKNQNELLLELDKFIAEKQRSLASSLGPNHPLLEQLFRPNEEAYSHLMREAATKPPTTKMFAGWLGTVDQIATASYFNGIPPHPSFYLFQTYNKDYPKILAELRGAIQAQRPVTVHLVKLKTQSTTYAFHKFN